MKVEDRFLPSQDLRSGSVSRPAETRPSEPPKAKKAESGSDSAGLSALSVEAARAIEQDSPEVVAKIARLQEAVANGTYSVPASAVARSLVDSLLAPDV
jgi:flagellar biosynthesis anti-sigma factor FlgM